VTFTIEPFTESLKRFRETFKAVQAGRHVEPQEMVGFTSLEAARNFLTRERLGLLDTIKSRHPGSIYELAKMTGLSYLEFLTHDLAQGDPERAVTEIQRAADRLKRIASLTPIALAAAIRKHPELRTHVQIKRLRQLPAQQMKDLCARRRAAEEDLLRELTEPR
jgi:hypothetical protein